MRQINKLFKCGLFCLLLITIFPIQLFCYIDPGTGSYVIQLLIAGLVGVSFFIRIFWKKIKNFISSVFSKKAKE